MVFSDHNNNQQRDNDESIERIVVPGHANEAIFWRASGSKRYIRYCFDGETRNQNGRLTICPENTALSHTRQIVIFRTGRPRPALHSEIKEGDCE